MSNTGAPARQSGDETMDRWHRVSKFSEGKYFDYVFLSLLVWMSVGGILDFQAHARGISFQEEGFITPSHLLVYTGLLAIGFLFTVTIGSRRYDGYSWLAAVPPGYRFGVFGVLLMAFGGFSDYLWHGAFGFEQGMEALTSPSHVAIMVGALLIVSSPLRSAWERDADTTALDQLPAVVSAGLILTGLVLFGQYITPLYPMAARGGVSHGLIQLLAFSGLFTGLCLVLMRRFSIVFGGFTLLFTIVTISMDVALLIADSRFLPVLVLTGVVADALQSIFQPSPANLKSYRAFSAVVPISFSAMLFGITGVTWGLEWEIHVWTGAILLSGLVGLLCSYLAIPYGRVAPPA